MFVGMPVHVRWGMHLLLLRLAAGWGLATCTTEHPGEDVTMLTWRNCKARDYVVASTDKCRVFCLRRRQGA